MQKIPMDDQPISSRFFGEGKWLSEFITPDSFEVSTLYNKITENLNTPKDRITACWDWVASQVRYKKFISGTLHIENKIERQNDLWCDPSLTIRVKVGNCLGAGTKVLTIKNGEYRIKRIEELADYEGYSVFSYNFESGKIEQKPILGWFSNGIREIISARFNNGETIKATPEHRLFHNGAEIALQDAIAGDADIHNIWRIPPLSRHPQSRFKYSPEHLWLVGMYLAEGCSGDSHVVICNDDSQILAKIESSLNTLRVPHSRTSYRHSNYVRILHKPVGTQREGIRGQRMGLDQLGHTAGEKHLTADFLSLSRNQLIEIMQGYCDGDGYLPTRKNVRRKFSSKHKGNYSYKKSFILQYGTASEELADQLKLIHLILCRPLWYYYEPNPHGAGKDPLPRHLMIENKKPSYGRIDDFRDLARLKIKEAVDTIKMPVYDLEIADNHNFMLANGILVHNCANKAFLLTSLLRRELSSDEVFCVLGNLENNGDIGGHAWCEINLGGRDFIMESTRPDVPPLVPTQIATRYQPVHLFNDKQAYYIEGATVMEPFSAAYSTWLKDYLDWAYIEGGGQKY